MADFKPIETQEDFDKMIQKRLEQKEREVTERFKEYSSPEDVAKIRSDCEGKIKEANDALKVERDKSLEINKSVSELKNRAEVAEKKLLKGKIAAEKGIPYELADRLIGNTEEELLKDAESISVYLAPKTAAPMFSNEHGGNANNEMAKYASLLAGLSNNS